MRAAVDADEVGAGQHIGLFRYTRLVLDEFVNAHLGEVFLDSLVRLVGSVEDGHGARLRPVWIELGAVHNILAHLMLYLGDALDVRREAQVAREVYHAEHRVLPFLRLVLDLFCGRRPVAHSRLVLLENKFGWLSKLGQSDTIFLHEILPGFINFG